MNANRHHANRPSALTAADRARLANHVNNKAGRDVIAFAVVMKLAALCFVCGIVAGCI